MNSQQYTALQSRVFSRLRSRQFWLITIGLMLLVLGVHQWRPFPVSWPGGMVLHHVTLFGGLYLALRWRYEAYLAFSAALGFSVAPLIFTGAPLGQFTLPWLGEFSLLTSGAIILMALMDYRWRHQVSPLFPTWFWCVMVPIALIATLGQWVHRDIFPYFLGDNASWLAPSVAVAVVLLSLSGKYWAALLIALVAVGYEWRLISDHNAWDYLADAYWLLATAPVLWWRWHQSDSS